jgi:carboxymethylenebutenolidase
MGSRNTPGDPFLPKTYPMQNAPISVPGAGRTLEAYLALPEERAGPHAAVIVIHEIFGPDRHIQDVARRFAREGYVALAPNLFTGEIQRLLTPEAIATGFGFLRGLPPEVQRDPPQIQARIAALPPEKRAALGALMKIQDPAQHTKFAQDLRAVADYLRGRSDVEARKIASVGFCFGGAMSGRLASADPDLAAAVIFYGNSPPAEEIPRIRCPVLGLYGAEDHRITDTIPKFAQEAKEAGVRLTYHIYPGAPHAFFNDTRAELYRAEAAVDAWKRVQAFLRTELGR